MEIFCSDLQQVQVTVYSQVLLAWQLLQASTTAQVRKESRGSPRWLQLEDSEAAVGFPSETEMDSAVSLRGKRRRVTVLCVIRSWCWRWASWCVPGRDAAGDGLAMASKLCSLCLNTSLGLNDRWEISDLASCSESKQQQSQWVFHTRQGSLTVFTWWSLILTLAFCTDGAELIPFLWVLFSSSFLNTEVWYI